MKRAIAGFVLVALASCSSAPDVRLPVSKIDEHAQKVLELMRAADQDRNGYVEGGEWYVLGAAAFGYFVDVATKLAAQAAAARANQPQS